jgi:hypothetical protein
MVTSGHLVKKHQLGLGIQHRSEVVQKPPRVHLHAAKYVQAFASSCNGYSRALATTHPRTVKSGILNESRPLCTTDTLDGRVHGTGPALLGRRNGTNHLLRGFCREKPDGCSRRQTGLDDSGCRTPLRSPRQWRAWSTDRRESPKRWDHDRPDRLTAVARSGREGEDAQNSPVPVARASLLVQRNKAKLRLASAGL